jgi:ABC-type ATPase involved in cell division
MISIYRAVMEAPHGLGADQPTGETPDTSSLLTVP